MYPELINRVAKYKKEYFQREHMRLPIQVEGIVFRRDNNGIEFLLLKRIKERDGFWQPISGGLEEGETLKECLLRELKEETGIQNAKLTKIDHTFQFKDSDLWSTEYVFAIEVPPNLCITLSKEHEKYIWADFKTALSLLKWKTNKQAFKKLNSFLFNGVDSSKNLE